ncbi:hypothetical protein KKB40_05850 [Patescibacteria group bacterium]|nr:hypothetical protein [Patescibacteria group bacterium]
MKKKKKFVVGDKIIESGQVYKIFKIAKRKDSNNKITETVYFKPHFKFQANSTLTCSVPYENLEMSEIRKPVSKEKMEFFIRRLSNKNGVKIFLDMNKAKLLLKSSNLADTVRIIRKLCKEKNMHDQSLSKSKRDILNLAIDRLTQELAAVEGLALRTAMEKIDSALGVWETAQPVN